MFDIKKNFNKIVAIRSASIDEDNYFSNAGKYTSILSVNRLNKNKLALSINKVIDSYNDNKKFKNYFIVQNMVFKPKLSGVIFTMEPNTGFPSVIVNYSKKKNTNSITSGSESGNQIIYFNHEKIKPTDKLIMKLKKNINKILKSSKEKSLDLEFCIDHNNKFILLQYRKLKIKNKLKHNINDLYKNYYYFYRKLKKVLPANNFLHGKKTFFSTMTDWNPAEMIGLKPKQLTYSLYQELITNDVWSKSRKELGYKDLQGFP